MDQDGVEVSGGETQGITGKGLEKQYFLSEGMSQTLGSVVIC
jgi:hypothetical protein